MAEMFLDEELESLSVMFSGVGESGHHVPHSAGLSYETSSNFLSIDESNMTILPPFDESLFCNWSTNVGNDCNSNHFSQEDSPSSGIDGSFLPIQSYDQNGYFPSNQFLKSVDSYMMNDPNNNALSEPGFSNDVMNEIPCIEDVKNEQASIDETSLKRKIHVEEAHSNCKPPKRKSCIPEDHVKKSKENITSRKKKQKMIENDTNPNEEGKRGAICPSSSEYISEDDSNASQELNGGASLESKESTQAPTSKIKTRASRGAATDPQSLYARRRRERINERLRILQNLVPNGTKVDISTMLEEAVHYVKFLQLQIKLLSSDELWMFAPIAYNGMDIGLYRRLGPNPLNI